MSWDVYTTAILWCKYWLCNLNLRDWTCCLLGCDTVGSDWMFESVIVHYLQQERVRVVSSWFRTATVLSLWLSHGIWAGNLCKRLYFEAVKLFKFVSLFVVLYSRWERRRIQRHGQALIFVVAMTRVLSATTPQLVLGVPRMVNLAVCRNVTTLLLANVYGICSLHAQLLIFILIFCLFCCFLLM